MDLHDGTWKGHQVPLGRRLKLLEGIRVLDLTRYLAGPFASLVLGDLGAVITKVEQLEGDSTRYNPPYFFEGDSAYFLSVNRNKRSIAMDIRAPAGREALMRLIARSDVVLDNLREPQRRSLGLSFPEISKANASIVHCSLTGFGSDGPYHDRPAYDIIVEALAGVMSVTGPEGGPSVRAGVPIGDLTAGLYAVIGVLAGLEYRRDQTRGVHIDIGMLDCQISLLSYLAQYFFVGGLVPTHQGRGHVSLPTYNTFATADGSEIVIAANTDEMWRSLCRVLGREELIEDKRFLDKARRLEHRVELIGILESECRKWKLNVLEDALLAAEVPVARINQMDGAFEDPQVRHREMVVRVEHHSGSEYLTVGNPVKADDALGAPFLSAPVLGGATVGVLQEVGYSDEEVGQLVHDGIVGVPSVWVR